MKKIVKIFSLLVIILGVAFMLSGCGDKEESSSSSNKENNTNETNEVVTTSKEKVIHGEYIRNAGYDSEIEMTFSGDDKLTKLVLIYDCATYEDAQKYYEDSLGDADGTNIKLEIDGKRVTVTMNAQGYMKLAGTTEDNLNEGTMRQVALGMGYNMKD